LRAFIAYSLGVFLSNHRVYHQTTFSLFEFR
jgi:hypothetical protein